MTETEPRIRLSRDRIAPGEVVEVRTLVSHVMETGRRRDAAGALVPRDIIRAFRCTFDGEPVFACALEPAISANPFLEFTVSPPRSGTLRFVWTADDGAETVAHRTVTVE